MTLLAAKHVLTAEGLLPNAAIHIDNGRITSIEPDTAPSSDILDGILAPGLIDVQVNGGGGVLFNDAPTVETLRIMTATHARFGVTGMMATLISDERSKIIAAIAAVGNVIDEGVSGVIGLHLEGPWLSTPRRGVHPEQFLRKFDDEDMRLLTQKRAFPLLVTIAPEQASRENVAALTEAGVIVSIGHTAAGHAEVEALLNAGATGFTHLFNAMPPLEGRKPGPVGVALASDAWAGLILDGIHVHPISARAAFAAKSANRLMLVSDAMATVGSATPAMQLFGENIEFSDGALRTPAGTLAGAHLDLSQAVRNAVSILGATPQDAVRMASQTPADFIRAKERGRIAVDARADIILLDRDLRVRKVWTDGKPIA